MLQNETAGPSTDTQSTDVPASKRRVTPQELTRALDSISAKREEAARRQEEEARRLAETIPIGQSVEELSLEATPEEIWAEVLSLRAQDDAASARSGAAFSPSRTDTRPAAHPRRKALGLAVLACAALSGAVLLLNSPHHTSAPTSWKQAVIPFIPSQTPSMGSFGETAPDAEFYRKLNLSQGPHPQYRILLRSPWGVPAFGRGATPNQTAYPLSAVPDGCTFYKPQFTGVSFGFGNPAGLSCVFAEIGAPASTQEWMMTRYDGRYYQHTWIPREDIQWLKQGRRVFLYPSPSASGGMTPLTLAVGSHPTNCYAGSAANTFEPCIQTGQSGVFLQLPEGKKVALDGHAWEDFTSFPPQEYQPLAWDKEPGTFVPNNKVGFGATAGFDASSQVEPLQAVPNGAPIHCSSVTLDQMLHAYPYTGETSQVLVDVRPKLDCPWTVIKFGGRPYLRGWIAARPAKSSLSGRDLAISSDSRGPDFVNPPVQITVPLDTLTWRGTMGGASPTPDAPGMVGKVIVTDVHLDGHAWERW